MKLKLGSVTFKTKTHDNAGKQPSWFDVFEFKRTSEELLELQVYDEDVISDDLVGSANLSLADICVLSPVKFSDSVKLQYKGKTAGELYLEIDFYPDAQTGYQGVPGYGGYPGP